MGATAFQRGLGAMHALSHPLGALYDAHHGLLNAIVMPYVLIANEREITDVLARLGSYLGLANAGFSGVVDHILRLRERLGIPHRLADIGIDDADAELVGQMAVVDPTAATNPIPFSQQQYSELFTRAVDGQV